MISPGRLAAAVAALGVLAVLGAVLLDRSAPAKDVPDVLRARQIELVDGSGQQRALIKVEDSGEVVFRLRDQDGTIRVKLGASRTGSGLVLLNEDTEPGVQALAGAKETSVSVARGDRRNEIVP
jgi:hypothetical protein